MRISSWPSSTGSPLPAYLAARGVPDPEVAVLPLSFSRFIYCRISGSCRYAAWPRNRGIAKARRAPVASPPVSKMLEAASLVICQLAWP